MAYFVRKRLRFSHASRKPDIWQDIFSSFWNYFKGMTTTERRINKFINVIYEKGIHIPAEEVGQLKGCLELKYVYQTIMLVDLLITRMRYD